MPPGSKQKLFVRLTRHADKWGRATKKACQDAVIALDVGQHIEMDGHRVRKNLYATATLQKMNTAMTPHLQVDCTSIRGVVAVGNVLILQPPVHKDQTLLFSAVA